MDSNGRLNGLLKKANVLCSRSNGMFSRSNGYRTVCKRDFFEPFAKALSYVFPERVTSILINKSVNQNSYPHLVIILTALFWSLCSLLPGVILRHPQTCEQQSKYGCIKVLSTSFSIFRSTKVRNRFNND